MSEHLLVPVILLSGGAGTRLWPLSRESAPKPFMPLPDGETLLAKTARRALGLPGVGVLVTVTNRDHYFGTRDVYVTLGNEAPRGRRPSCSSPCGRNTAPAVAAAALYAQAHFGGGTVLLILAADHLIHDQAAFAAAVARATALALRGELVTFGIAPTHPETGFGYIESGAAVDAFEPPAFASRASSRSPRSRRRSSIWHAATTTGTRGCSALPRMRSSVPSPGTRQRSWKLCSPVIAALKHKDRASMLELDRERSRSRPTCRSTTR